MVGRLPDTTVHLEADVSDVITSDHVATNICCIARDILASIFALDGGAENSYDDGDGFGVDVYAIPIAKISSSNSQLPSDASTE